MDRLVNLTVFTGLDLTMENTQLFGKHQGCVSSLANVFNETIVNGFIISPKFVFSHLSILMIMNPEGNLLNINDNSVNFRLNNIDG